MTAATLKHLATAELADDDPETANDALCAAARKALTAALRQHGLRPTQADGHEAVILASDGAVHLDEVRADLPVAEAIVNVAAKVLEHRPVFVPDR